MLIKKLRAVLSTINVALSFPACITIFMNSSSVNSLSDWDFSDFAVTLLLLSLQSPLVNIGAYSMVF